ncbi:hypothetical protein LTR22_008878 [Elasticomyces elasticus]|nr:hypothetical protein LTR22_008878 [Elasticomyces elasticus]KAK4921173.1 hypothetical protein LTR49_011360 [Elasticomyces elasticus]KAK5761890.1 hypothetical protein LTS12_007953 [Elasticomyces elasticus]
MAHTVTLGGGQLQLVLDITLAANKTLMTENQELKAELEVRTLELQTLKQDAQKLNGNTRDSEERSQTFGFDNNALTLENQAQVESRQKTTKISAALKAETGGAREDCLSPKKQKLELNDQHARPQRERPVKREIIEIESDDDVALPSRKRVLMQPKASAITSGRASPGEQSASQDDEQTNLTIMATGHGHAADPNGGAKLGSDGVLPVSIIAFDESGKTYSLSAGNEPARLHDLISQAETSAQEVFDAKHGSKLHNYHKSWQSLVRRSQSCVRAACLVDAARPILPGRGDARFATCRRCFSACVPCMRYDAATRSIHVVPLPLIARHGVSSDELGYYIYPWTDGHTALERSEGPIWGKNQPRFESGTGQAAQGRND